ncbi:type II toxin-antitoxin system RelE/ParE family toxin [Leptolyngbya sp. PCC 6406]|uniref:type II toxin-antitoxin system RelE/ParE family toxin n=1 Tax=Leptolyngbya sp. PCC 6406 TaxID=1173264 RepID=UPI0002ABA63F|nr:type II toxin-antitoxin system RelE/ParE family toxin [Leptolyngbya sp. PCC 6406]
MPPQFYLTQPAIQDIEAIADYISGQTGLQQAERFLSKLDAKFARITQFPNLGRPRDEILPELRSLALESYLILYIATESRVDILRVVSGYRDLTSLFIDDDE